MSLRVIQWISVICDALEKKVDCTGFGLKLIWIWCALWGGAVMREIGLWILRLIFHMS